MTMFIISPAQFQYILISNVDTVPFDPIDIIQDDFRRKGLRISADYDTACLTADLEDIPQ